jgi:hypothetical protein
VHAQTPVAAAQVPAAEANLAESPAIVLMEAVPAFV